MIWRALTLLPAIAAALLAVPATRHLREAPPPAPPLVHAAFTPPDGAELGSGEVALDAAISPNGEEVVFAAAAAGEVQLWRRAIAGGGAQPLPGTGGAAYPAWKPGGRVVAFIAGGTVQQIALDGGAVRVLSPVPAGAGVAWLDDGSIVFAPAAGGALLALRDGAAREITQLRPGDRAHAWPTAAAGNSFVYLAIRDDGGRVLRWLRRDVEVELTAASSHGIVVEGLLLYVRDSTLLAHRIDPDRGVTIGRAMPLVTNVGTARDGRGFFAGSARLLLAAPPRDGGRELYWADARGARVAELLEPGDYWQVRLAPDDNHAAVTALDPLLRTLDVLAVPVDVPADARRLSLSLGPDSDPVWSPDSRRVVFHTQQRGAGALLSRDLLPVTAVERTIAPAAADIVPSDWRDGTLLGHATDPPATSRRDIWAIDLERGARRRITSGSFNEWDARWSPDGRWIAYVSDESGRPEIYVDAWPTGGQRVRVSFAGGARPQWAATGRTLLFMRQNDIVQTQLIASDDRIRFGPPELVIREDRLVDFAVAHRSNRLVILAGAHRAAGLVTFLIDWTGLLPPLGAPVSR